MNEEKIKQFEKEQLNVLLDELKDIDKFTEFSNGAFKYQLGKYQANSLLNYIEKLKEQLQQRDSIIEEAIKKTKVVKEYKFDLIGRNEILDILNKYKGDNK